ncbi:MAG: high-potential iron-sulfur protein [Dyella sp.]
MSQENNNDSRRRFLKFAAGTAAVAAVVGAMPSLARAADLPHVGADDATAKALGYVEDASKTTNAMHKAGDNCANCQFYTAGNGGYGPCQLFPGKAVNAKGWCISHAPKPA